MPAALRLGATATLTFLFTDIEGSTALLGRLGEVTYARLLAEHHRLIRDSLAAHGGNEMITLEDGFFGSAGVGYRARPPSTGITAPVIPLLYGAAWYEYSTKDYTGWPTESNQYIDPVPNAPYIEYTLLHLTPAS